jgi:hypothetical protein
MDHIEKKVKKILKRDIGSRIATALTQLRLQSVIGNTPQNVTLITKRRQILPDDLQKQEKYANIMTSCINIFSYCLFFPL